MYPRTQPVKNVAADAIEISFHLVVPEPKRFETFIGEMAISRFIFAVSGMLATVDFYDQLASEADEIEDVEHAVAIAVGALFACLEEALEADEVEDVEVNLTFTPPWDPETMASEDGKMELGIW